MPMPKTKKQKPVAPPPPPPPLKPELSEAEKREVEGLLTFLGSHNWQIDLDQVKLEKDRLASTAKPHLKTLYGRLEEGLAYLIGVRNEMLILLRTPPEPKPPQETV